MKDKNNFGTKYHEPYHWRLRGLSLEIKLFVLKLARNYIAEDQKILDIGCGDGFTTNLLSKIALEVIGIDISSSGIRFAKTKCGWIQFVLASATSLPFRTQYFDTITMFEVIEHLYPQDAEKAVHEIHFILKKTGKFILTTPNPLNLYNLIFNKRKVSEKHCKEYNLQELIRLLKGFETIKISGVYLPLPILWWFSKPKYEVFYKPLIIFGEILPRLSKNYFWCGKKSITKENHFTL